MEKLLLIAVLVLGLMRMGFVGCTSTNTNQTKSEQPPKTTLYQCPMGCEKGKTHEKKGKCSVCEMDMERK